MEMIKTIMFPSIIMDAFDFIIIIIIIIIIINDNDGNINTTCCGWKYRNLYYFFTIDLFNLYIFCPIFALRVITMF